MPAARKSISKTKARRVPPDAPAMPEQCARVILHLADGTQVRGIWTGKKWWANRCEVQPVKWEYPQSLIRRQRKVAEGRRGAGKGLKSAKKASMAMAGCVAEASK